MHSPSSKIPAGHSYLFTDDGVAGAFAALRYLLVTGHRGLVLSKTQPDKIPPRYDIDCPIIWIVSKPPPGGKAITVDPERLGKIYSMIGDFVKNNPGAAVLLEGLDILIKKSDFPSVMKALQMINESIAISKSIFLLPVDPKSFNPQEFSFLEREIPLFEYNVDLL